MGLTIGIHITGHTRRTIIVISHTGRGGIGNGSDRTNIRITMCDHNRIIHIIRHTILIGDEIKQKKPAKIRWLFLFNLASALWGLWL